VYKLAVLIGPFYGYILAYLLSGEPPFCWTPRHAGSSHQNWARPTEFCSCCTDRLELSSSTPALDTD